MDYSVRRKELYAYIYTENVLGHALIFWLRVLNSFLLLLSFFFFLLHSCPLFSYYILWLFLPFPPSTCGSGVGSPFFLLLLPFLESFILNCKAACSLFRYYLHINATRGLAGQHLMWRQQYPQIFVSSHSYPLFDIFSFTLLQGLSEALP